MIKKRTTPRPKALWTQLPNVKVAGSFPIPPGAKVIYSKKNARTIEARIVIPLGKIRKPLKVRKPIPKQSKRGAYRSRVYNAAVKPWKIGRGCEAEGMIDPKTDQPICGERFHPCDECHHFRGRDGTLLMDRRGWIPVCSMAHRWIDANRDAARALGLLALLGYWGKAFAPEAITESGEPVYTYEGKIYPLEDPKPIEKRSGSFSSPKNRTRKRSESTKISRAISESI